MTRSFRAIAVALLLAGGVRAEPTASSEASRHFQTGLSEAGKGNLTAALEAFELAYAAQPHFSVLYNIGKARSALGKPVQAIAAFERYLAEGGTQIGDERRAEVSALLASSRRLVGQLQIFPGSAGARVWLDGIELAPARVASPIVLSIGQHVVLQSVRGCEPTSQTVAVPSMARVELRLGSPAACDSSVVAALIIDCDLPDVSVEVDGVAVSKTPLRGPLLVRVGVREVKFSRLGYDPAVRRTVVREGTINRLVCDQRPSSFLPSELQAGLQVRTRPSSSVAYVDGKRFLGQALPAGAHRLRVEREGFRPYEGVLLLSANKTTVYEARLAPTPARERAQRRRKTAGLVLGGVALGALGTASGLYVWNGRRYDDWQRERSQLDEGANLGRATAIQRVDDLSLGLALASAALVATGAWLLFETD